MLDMPWERLRIFKKETMSISPGGFNLQLGDMAGAAPALDTLGATAGYMWIFKRDGGDISLAIDNVTYVPEPATMCLLGFGALSLIRRKRKA